MASTYQVNLRKVLILLTVLLAGPLFAQQNGLAPSSSGQLADDIYMAGATVQVLTDVKGDVVVAGGSISVANSVTEDVLAAGGTVNILASVGDDIRAAGGSVAILGDVGGDVVAAGGTVVIDSTSTVGGRAWLAGGTVTVAGNVNHELRATARKIILSGTINGDVDIYAESIEIKPSAVIKGNLTYSAPSEADIHKDASIEGAVNHKQIEFKDFDNAGTGFIGDLMFYISLAASAIALFLLFPLRSISVVKQLQDTPVKSSGLGLVVLTSTPLIALMLLVSVVGVPIALVALALYAVVLIVGVLIGVILVGDFVFRQLGKKTDESKRMRAWSIGAGAASLFIVDLIPFIGGLVFFIVLLLGVGGLTQFCYQLYGHRGESLATVARSGE